MPHPHISLAMFTKVACDLGMDAAERIDHSRRSIDDTKTSLAKNLDELERRTSHFINCGWADLRNWHSMPVHPYNAGYGNKCWDWRQYFRHLARDMHRPFIWVAQRYHSPLDQSGAYLHIPRRKSLLPLSASFLLLDNQKSHNTVEWIWCLDHDQFEWWCEQLERDLEWRKAVGLM